MSKYATISITKELKKQLSKTCIERETWTDRIARAVKAEAELRLKKESLMEVRA